MRRTYSVVIPSYNSEQTIERCISSVLVQKFLPLEIVLVDNNSQDSTVSIAKSVFPLLAVININGGGVVAKSRNTGLNSVKSEYVCFLDSDDYWAPQKIEKSFSVIDNREIDIIFHNEYWVSEKNMKVKKYFFRHIDPFESLVCYGNSLSTSAVMIRRQFLLKNQISFDEARRKVGVEDYDLWCNLFLNKPLSIHINEPLGFFSMSNYSYSKKVRNFAVRSFLIQAQWLRRRSVRSEGTHFFRLVWKDPSVLRRLSMALKIRMLIKVLVGVYSYAKFSCRNLSVKNG